MINFFVDASLLAFPEEASSENEDDISIEMFFRNLDRLIKLAQNPQIVLWIHEDLHNWLNENGCYFVYPNGKSRTRINRFRETRPNRRTFIDTRGEFYDIIRIYYKFNKKMFVASICEHPPGIKYQCIKDGVKCTQCDLLLTF